MTHPSPAWPDPPAALRLGSTEVHVWRSRLDVPAAWVQSLQYTLSADEWQRADRFYFHADRQRFILTRGLLRVILGRYLEIEPARLRFSYGPYGKPFLDQESEADALRFNVSHSRGLALFAVTRGREVGVDVERIRPDLVDEQMARRFFSPPEVASLLTLPRQVQTEAFFTCWTRKEAYLKARGDGLSFPLDQFAVSLAPGEPAALLSTRGDPQEIGGWSLHDLIPGPGYAASLAVKGDSWQLKCWQWPPLAAASAELMD